jgi:hypothetical protein
MPVTDAESWTVLGPDGAPVEPVESFLAYLSALERSPNPQRAYATSLKLWFEFLGTVGVDWAASSNRNAPIPNTQRASDESFRQRLDTARAEIQRLRSENAALRDQVARALGEQRIHR